MQIMTPVAPLTLASFEPRIAAFVQECDGYVDWGWDGRFGVAWASLDAADGMLIRDAADECFEHAWTSETIGDAGARIAKVARDLGGGLRPGQSLVATDPSDEVVLYCAWWPWNDGRRISIRVGIAGAQDANAQLREWFGLG